ncbi:uncharacterized protein AMSG_09615 [Thecamonas trahens ATCC 50062]|uniref:Transmembrane protein n=1 Tax=Thecamonas trahens ATCC 50062 TaxID=461836 RepID=A0A0L0DNS2_THETB|nr:hypothetical protein AMSG_09615 [Thecamonas trahens ATCC 50062]KNC53967.1 hypothetical protein AMSG_09615 [Thecamonas trahens ATCC 50062]|eukprot:XP_013754169.1 hypothetical protein AMSG_09615 [Thecamonas trahens ATCC 50062]
MSRKLLYPGTKADRLHYVTIRFVPLLAVGVWLLWPLYAPPTLDHAALTDTSRPEPKASFWLYLTGFALPYSLTASAVGYALYGLVLPLPSMRILLPLAVGVSLLDSGLRAMAFLLEWSPLSIVLPLCTIPASIPFFLVLGWHAYSRGQDRHAVTEWLSARNDRTAHLVDFLFRKDIAPSGSPHAGAVAAGAASAADAVARHAAGSSSETTSSGPGSYSDAYESTSPSASEAQEVMWVSDWDSSGSSNGRSEILGGPVRSGSSSPEPTVESYAGTESELDLRSGSSSPDEYTVMSESSRYVADSSAAEYAEEHSFVRTFLWMAALLVVILVTYAFCQVFTAFFIELSRESLSATTQALFVFAFSVPLLLFKTLTKFVVGKFDAVHEADIKPVALYTMDLFFFVFQRNLFLEVESYAVILFVNVYDVLVDVVVYGLLASRPSHRVQSWFASSVQSVPCLGTLVPRPVSYELFVQQSIMDFFFYVVAETMSLIAFGSYTVLLHYSHNAPGYRFSERDGVGHDDELPRFVAYMFITLGFSIISVLLIRYLHSRALNVTSFEVGALVLRAPRVRLALVLVAIHVLQDLYLAIFKLNFAAP